MFKVYDQPCKNCLLSKDRIVSPKRAKEIIKGCAQDQSHFICHKASMEGKDVCCHTFYEEFGHVSQLIRIMQRINGIEMVPVPEGEKLMTYTEMKKLES